MPFSFLPSHALDGALDGGRASTSPKALEEASFYLGFVKTR
jgi:hypothetical protein